MEDFFFVTAALLAIATVAIFVLLFKEIKKADEWDSYLRDKINRLP